MAKKIRVKVVWYVFWIAALVTCSLYLKAVGKNGYAILLFLFVVYFFSELAKLFRDWYFYRELCSELEDVGKNPARQAVKIYHLRSIGLWLRCAPKEEKERFAVHLAQMSEKDFGYSELKSIVEQFKNNKYGKQRLSKTSRPLLFCNVCQLFGNN